MQGRQIGRVLVFMHDARVHYFCCGRRYRGVLDKASGQVLQNQNPNRKSYVKFEWSLMINGAIMQREECVRADHATVRGVPLPDELAAAIATSAMRKVASRAVEACRMDSSCEYLQCAYRGVVNEEPPFLTWGRTMVSLNLISQTP